MLRILALFTVAGFLFACGSSKEKETKIASVEDESVLYGTEDESGIEHVKTQEVYHPAETKYTDLVHTSLSVSFNWEKSELEGEARITAKPHFYATDSLVLDAKSMLIHEVKMDGKPLTFNYENDFLTIDLGKTFTRNDKYTVYIKYTARPEERREGGSAAITSDKGLFFINPKGENPNVMPQIWTQGETEASSVWFPTIDAPNAKTTQEIFMTVEDKYVTLSNGKFMGSQKNEDGTRTDHWKQDLPHAPYLFMMGVGEFKVVEDQYIRQDSSVMPVNYYVEPEWEEYADDIFGETPEMIRYFSEILGVEYPWDKYHQIIVRDYVSGAMENTGAVVYGDWAYRTERELLDANAQSTIAHELFHHWFGDLVTCESWANLTLNESFANYSQYLWDEHRYGKDEADYQAMIEENGYMQSANMQGYHDLVWFAHKNKEDMFDGHSYNKGGRILHMLRNHLGDEAFFKGLQLYLKTHSFKAAEFHHLRLAFEEVSGQDLNWFFNQWYLGSGHPQLKVRQKMDSTGTHVLLAVEQTQDLDEWPLFILPIKVAVHDTQGEHIHEIVIDKEEEVFTLPFSGELKSVIFDADEILLAEINEKKEEEQYAFQYYLSDKFKTRMKGLQKGATASNGLGQKLVLDALGDPFWKIRVYAINEFEHLDEVGKEKALAIIKNLAINDPKSQVRAEAIELLSKNLIGDDLFDVLTESVNTDQSYLVMGAAIKGMAKADPMKALAQAEQLEGEKSSQVLSSVAYVYGVHGTEKHAAFFSDVLTQGKLKGFDQLSTMNIFTQYNARMSPEVVLANMDVYDNLKENGGFYTKMFLGRNTDYLKKNIEGTVSELEEKSKTLNEEGNADEANNLNTQIETWKKVLGRLESLSAE